MKKIIILILLISINISFGQVIPKEFVIKQLPELSRQQFQSDKSKQIQYNVRFAPIESNVIISNFISDVIVVGDTIWFGTGKGITRTYNNGNTFQNYYGTPPFGEDDVSGIAVYRNYIVVGTAISVEINEELTLPAGTGIKVSSDFGNTWNSYPQPKELMLDTIRYDSIQYGNNYIKSLKITTDITNLSYDILITKKNLTSDSIVIWITSWAGELRKSVDYGATFTRVLLPPDDLDSIYPGGTYNFVYDPNDPINGGNDNHKGFSVTAENDSTIYVGTAGGINKSTDWGVSWRKYNYENTGSGSGISGNFVVALEVQRYASRIIVWGATNVGGGASGQSAGISFTTNSGLTWGNTLTGDESVFSHAVGFKDSLVYAATDNGIYRSYFTPPNFSWSKPSIIYDEEIKDWIRTNFFYAVDSQGDSIWVGSGDGLARTRDLGNPWTEKWKIFRGYRTVASTTETYAAPNPFSPDDEVTRIYYKTGKTNATVTIRLFDFGMNPVRVLIQNAPRNGPDMQWTAWNGLRDDGRQVANGVYFYRIEVDGDLTFWGKILVLQ